MSATTPRTEPEDGGRAGPGPSALAARVATWGLAHPWALALAGYVVAFVAVTWPLVTRFGSATFGGPGDGWALIWQTWSRHEQGAPYFSTPVNPDLAWPFGSEYAASILLSNAVTELPNLLLLSLGVGDVAAYNVIVMGGAVASSMAMYAVVRRLGSRPAIAFWAGLVYMLAPWHIDRAAIHPTLSLMAALPLLLLGVVEWSRRPGLRSGAIVVAAAILAAYTHVYYGLFAALVLAAGLVIALLAAAHRQAMREMLVRTAALAGMLAIVAAPLALALAGQRGEVTTQLQRPLYLTDLAAELHLYLLPSDRNPIFGGLVTDYLTGRDRSLNEGELALYLGWVTIALAVLAVVAVARGRASRIPIAAAVAMVVIGLVMALPSHVTLPLVGSIRTPVDRLNDAVDFISTPARFFALTLTGTVVLAAIGLGELVRSLPHPRWALGVVALAVVVSTAELVIDPSGRVVSAAPPPIYQAVERRVPEGEPLAQYPSSDRSLRPVADQLFRQVFHGRPILNGASVGTVEDNIRREVQVVTDAGVPETLALLGYRWVTYEPAEFEYVSGGIGTAYEFQPPPGMRMVERTEESSQLIRVTASPAPGMAARAAGFHLEGGREGHLWVTGDRAELLVCATAAGTYRLRSQGYAFALPRTVRIGGTPVRLPNSERSRPFEVSVDLRPGWQWIPIRLVGSRPVRPSDIVPGSIDPRPLAVSLAGFAVEGPSGDPARCRTAPPEPPAL